MAMETTDAHPTTAFYSAFGYGRENELAFLPLVVYRGRGREVAGNKKGVCGGRAFGGFRGFHGWSGRARIVLSSVSSASDEWSGAYGLASLTPVELRAIASS